MQTFDLKATSRKETGKKATKQARRDGNIPCVLYGGEKIQHFSAPVNDFRKLIYTPNVYLVNLTIDENKSLAMIKDIQFHPVTDKILHIDFLEVVEGRPIEIGIPVTVKGFSKGVQAGGKLKVEMRRLKVFGIAENLPDTLTIDVTNIALGESVKVRDLKFDNLELTDPQSAVVVSVKLTRIAKGMAAPEDGEGEEVEGEGEGEGEAVGGEESAESTESTE